MPLQLGLGLNRRLGGFNPFNPTHLNPHLLFDTRTSMLGELESPTLDLDAAVPSSLDVITATRSGVATYTDIDGNIQSADPNTVRVDYTQGEELTPTVFQRVEYTDFSADWFTYVSSFTIQSETLNGNAILRWTTTGGSAQLKHNIYTEEGKIYTYSFYVRLISNDGGNNFRAFSQYSPTGNHPNITITENWQKVVVTFDGRVGGGNVAIGLIQAGTHTVSNVLEYSTPQVVDGEIEYDFVPNTTGSPKFIASATFGPRVPMMLIEPSATNLVNYSEDFSGYLKSNATVTSASVTAPDGTTNASKVIATPVSASHFIYKSVSHSAATNTVSVYAKAAEYDNLRLQEIGNYHWYASFDLSSGAVSATGGLHFVSATAVDVGNGWWRCSIVQSKPTGSAFSMMGFPDGSEPTNTPPNYLGDGESGIYIWGAQVEEGSVATSYIPTSGSTVTRNADNLVIDGSNFTDFYNGSEGTVYVEGLGRELSNNNYFLAISNNGDFNNSFRLFHNSNSTFFVKTSGVTQVNVNSGTVSLTSLNRGAFSYATNNFKSSMNGASEASDTSGSLPSVNQLQIGWGKGGNQLNGHIKRLIYWPTHSDSL